jgi:ATP-dependent RNA helicase TDRD9
VLGVRYVIDFCLGKEVRFDIRSRMENLELVWASKASCNQRAGRTGRVCDGIVFRMLE